jgi:inner membrane protein
MDAVTQGALGAACAQACFGRLLGRRAVLWGALGALAPDVDGVAAGLLGAFDDLRRHRGLTHALWFAPVAGPVLGYGVWRLHARWKRLRASAGAARPRPAASLPDPGDLAMLGTWMALFVVALLAHSLLDLFTTYGAAPFWPFSERRLALGGIGAIDPLYAALMAGGVLLATCAATPRLPRQATSAGRMIPTTQRNRRRPWAMP